MELNAFDRIGGHPGQSHPNSLGVWVFSSLGVLGLFGLMSAAFFDGSRDSRVLEAAKSSEPVEMVSELFSQSGRVEEGRSASTGTQCDSDNIRRITTALLDQQQYARAGEALKLISDRCSTYR